MTMKTNKKINLLHVALLTVIFLASLIVIVSPANPKTIIRVPTQTPTVVPTISGWQIYKNSQYNFEFQYPGNLKIQETNSKYLPFTITFLNKEDTSPMSVDVNNNFSIEKIKSDTANYKYLGQIKIGNYNVEKYTTPGFEFEPLDTYTLKLGNYYYTLTKTINDKTLGINDQNILQVLSTIKLIQ